MTHLQRYRALTLAALVAAACASSPEKQKTPAQFYPPPPADPRYQLLARFTSAEDVEEPSAFQQFVAGEAPGIGVRRAQGVAWYQRCLYVCDTTLSQVFVFDLGKREFRTLDSAKRSKFNKPIEIEIAPDGWKYITDTAHKKVLVYDDKDQYRTAFGDPKTWRPVGLAVTDELLYVTDVQNHQVVVLERETGRELRRVGEHSGADGGFYYPVEVAVGPSGDLYVADSFNFRIQRLKSDGTFVRNIGKQGTMLGGFTRPHGVAVDREGRIYALDSAYENCQVFDEEGKLLLFFGGPGPQPGAINMPGMVKVSYDAAEAFRDQVAEGYDIDYVVFISSQAGPHKVNVYGFLRKR